MNEYSEITTLRDVFEIVDLPNDRNPFAKYHTPDKSGDVSTVRATSTKQLRSLEEPEIPIQFTDNLSNNPHMATYKGLENPYIGGDTTRSLDRATQELL
jgi:hypothetical protein